MTQQIEVRLVAIKSAFLSRSAYNPFHHSRTLPLNDLSMLFKNFKITFLLLTETIGELLQTSLKIAHSKNVSLASSESEWFALQYCTFSSTTMSSRSLSLNERSSSIKLHWDKIELIWTFTESYLLKLNISLFY